MDNKEAKIILEKNQTWGKFISNYWLDFEEYAKVQDFKPDNIILNHHSIKRVAYILLQGEVEAFTITKDDAKYVHVYNFNAGMTVADIVAIFNSPWTFGLRSLSHVSVLAIDLDQIERTTDNFKMYEELFDIVHSELGVITAEVNNHRIDKGINVKEILPGELFQEILSGIDQKDYEILKNNLNFIFYNENQEVLTNGEKVENLYFIRTGKLNKTNPINNEVQDFDDNLGLTEYFDGSVSNFDFLTSTKCLIIKLGINDIFNTVSEKLKNKIYKIIISNNNTELKVAKKKLSQVEDNYEAQKIRNKRISILSIKSLILLAVSHLLLSAEHSLEFLHSYRPIFHSLIVFISVLVFFNILRKSKIDISSLGFNNRRKKAFFELGIVVLLLVFISIASNDLLVTYGQDNVVKTFLYPGFINEKNLYASIYWYYIAISLVYVAVYEIIVRGIWQTWLESIFIGGYWARAWKSIICTNIIAGMFFSSLFYEFYFVMFFAGICFGYIYAKYKNLYAVILGHIIYEIIVVSVVGLVVF